MQQSSQVSEALSPIYKLNDLAINERPQERLERFGAGALSDTELLAMLLRSGSKDLDVLSLSRKIIAEAGSLSGLLKWSVDDFRKQKGIGKVKALQLLTVMEVARRVLRENPDIQPVLDSPELIFNYFRSIATGLDVEKFWVLCLNRKNRLIRQVEVTSGTATASLVHPREVFREAIKLSATSIVCVHNHPSGDPSPSAADIKATRAIRDAARIIDISLLDHVIVGQSSMDPQNRGYYSFVEAGFL